MSLVAYASSDEGESSGADESPEALSEPQIKNKKTIDTHENDQDKSSEKRVPENDRSGVEAEYSFPIEDDEYDILPNNTRGLTLPPPKHGTETKPSTSVDQGGPGPSSILSGEKRIRSVSDSHYYRPQGKVMFSQASVILFTIGLMATWSLLILVGYSVTAHPFYGAVGTHPTGMLSC